MAVSKLHIVLLWLSSWSAGWLSICLSVVPVLYLSVCLAGSWKSISCVCLSVCLLLFSIILISGYRSFRFWFVYPTSTTETSPHLITSLYYSPSSQFCFSKLSLSLSFHNQSPLLIFLLWCLRADGDWEFKERIVRFDENGKQSDKKSRQGLYV